MADHVHILLFIPPKYPVFYIVGFIKGKSAIFRVHDSVELTKHKSIAVAVFPKGTDLAGYTQLDLNRIAFRLNQRPRKTVGFCTPADRLEAGVVATG